jgi:hypothetical protein
LPCSGHLYRSLYFPGATPLPNRWSIPVATLNHCLLLHTQAAHGGGSQRCCRDIDSMKWRPWSGMSSIPSPTAASDMPRATRRRPCAGAIASPASHRALPCQRCLTLPRPRSTPAAVSDGNASCRPLLSRRRLAPPVHGPALEPSPVASRHRPLPLQTSMQMRERKRE